jgi:hypothetical protein
MEILPIGFTFKRLTPQTLMIGKWESVPCPVDFLDLYYSIRYGRGWACAGIVTPKAVSSREPIAAMSTVSLRAG